MTLGVVIPVYRGIATIGGVVEALYRFSEARRLQCRVVLVEDMSGDGSREEVLKLAARHTGVTAVLPAPLVIVIGRPFTETSPGYASFASIRMFWTCSLV